MIKKIQNYLLVHHPLLWNTKIVPLSCFLLIIHVTFFIIGYSKGYLDFTETSENYRYSSADDSIIVFSIVIAIMSAIIWLVLYFKNNAFKAFYPRRKYSLYREWLIILFGCFLMCAIPVSFIYGKQVRIKSYYSEAEAKKRCEILTMASMFIEGSFINDGMVEADSSGFKVMVPTDHFVYKGKKYPLNSLLNKNLEDFSFFNLETDSLYRERARTWLVNNQKDSVAALFQKYLDIASQHNLNGNTNREEWLNLVYHYPNFEENRIVASRHAVSDYAVETDTKDLNNVKIDTLNQYVKFVNGYYYTFNKNYVPASQLNYSYGIISDAWVNPPVDSELLLMCMYFAIAFSVVIFSFRTSNGRNWLIALIVAGVVNIIFGLVMAFTRYDIIYGILLLAFSVMLYTYFGNVIVKNKTKEISGIALNMMLWAFPCLLPLAYMLLLEYLYYHTGYKSYSFELRAKEFPIIHSMYENKSVILYLNIIFIIFGMLYFSVKIKKWKGIAES